MDHSVVVAREGCDTINMRAAIIQCAQTYNNFLCHSTEEMGKRWESTHC